MRRNRLPKSGHCDKINFGGCDNGRGIEQPLFIKSKEDGSWTSVQNSAYHFSQASTMSLASTTPSCGAGVAGSNISTNKFKFNASNNSINSPNLNNSSNNNINNATISSNQIHLSSFGRADNV